MVLNGYQSYPRDRSHSNGMDLNNNVVCVCAMFLSDKTCIHTISTNHSYRDTHTQGPWENQVKYGWVSISPFRTEPVHYDPLDGFSVNEVNLGQINLDLALLTNSPGSPLGPGGPVGPAWPSSPCE